MAAVEPQPAETQPAAEAQPAPQVAASAPAAQPTAEKPAAEMAAAAQQPADTQPAAEAQPAAPQVAASEAAAPATEQVAAAEPASDGVVTVMAAPLQSVDSAVIIRRGDTLWRISRRVYGRGVRYSTIYLANQEQIEDPDRIWPGQVFRVPDKTSEGEAADIEAMGAQVVTPAPATTAQ
jgi:nucleoid-associated protein YgaU